MATEEPAFSVAFKAGDMEVRDYPALIAARVTVGGDRNAAGSAGFRMLAGYIFGGNTKKQSIAMTAPVTQRGDPGNWVVQFIMPREYALATLPTPRDPRVQLKALPPTRLAVIRFSGLTGEAALQKQTSALETFIAERHLHALGRAALARYDPPWTPWFMRRNEIWIPVDR